MPELDFLHRLDNLVIMDFDLSGCSLQLSMANDLVQTRAGLLHSGYDKTSVVQSSQHPALQIL